MTTLLILCAGMALFGVSAFAGGREALRAHGRREKVAARLEALQPESATTLRETLLGPEHGPPILRTQFARAGLEVTRKSAVAAVAATVLAVLATAWLQNALLAAGLLAVAAAAAWATLRHLAARNVAGLIRELPFMLDGVRQHLNVGASLQQALTRGVEQGGPEIGRFFLPVVRRMQNGATPSESLSWLAGRLAVPEIDMLALAVQSNLRFGGAISPVLANLAQILRDRARVARELRAATAETRFSGWILAGLPVLAMLFLAFGNPKYLAFLTSTPIGHTMLAFAFGFQAAGLVVMRRVLRLEF